MTKSPYVHGNMRYCGRGLPRTVLPDGKFLVHNHVRPVPSLGLNGFRAWVQTGDRDPPLIECKCNFGGLKNAKLQKHYRVRR